MTEKPLFRANFMEVFVMLEKLTNEQRKEYKTLCGHMALSNSPELAIFKTNRYVISPLNTRVWSKLHVDIFSNIPLTFNETDSRLAVEKEAFSSSLRASITLVTPTLLAVTTTTKPSIPSYLQLAIQSEKAMKSQSHTLQTRLS